MGPSSENYEKLQISVAFCSVSTKNKSKYFNGYLRFLVVFNGESPLFPALDVGCYDVQHDLSMR
jgi:hypothetical protein